MCGIRCKQEKYVHTHKRGRSVRAANKQSRKRGVVVVIVTEKRTWRRLELKRISGRQKRKGTNHQTIGDNPNGKKIGEK